MGTEDLWILGELVVFLEAIRNDQISDFEDYLGNLPAPSILRLPRPEMLPEVGLPQSISVPPLATVGDLADWLGVTAAELDWFSDQDRRHNPSGTGPLLHYRYRVLRKNSGGVRLLEIPKPRLKQIQRQILHEILDSIVPHSAAHAYRSGRSVATYVTPHAGKPVLLHIDLREFFPSVRAARIHALLRTVGYPDQVARHLTALCTTCTRAEAFSTGEGEGFAPLAWKLYLQRHLPQGAPTSPALVNLCAWRLDVRLTALAQRFEASYTRYADDLLFSGGAELQRGMQRFRILVLTIALDEGFSIRTRKTRVLLESQSQQVAGVVLNEHPNLPRDEFDRLKALLFNCVRHGPASQNRDQRDNFAQHLQGRISYWAMINPQRAAKLQKLFDEIKWSSGPTL